MRIGVVMPFTDRDGVPLDIAGIAERARWIESVGLDGTWALDGSFRGPPMPCWPDPLMWLLTACAATERIEVGTEILQVPLRNPVDLAQRFMTLEALTHGRFSVGVGPGSSPASHAAVGIAFEDRFKVFNDYMDTIKRLCSGETVGAATIQPWPSTLGGPPMLIGAWYSETALRRAAKNYDRWICSGGRTNYGVIRETIKLYRDLGGARALVATVSCDLAAPTKPMTDDDPFNLNCEPSAASDRLHELGELGFDDVLLSVRDPRATGMFSGDIALEQLEQVRTLVPADPRPRYPERRPSQPASGSAMPVRAAVSTEMQKREITMVATGPDGAITAVGGPWGQLSSAAALIDVRNGQFAYVVTVGASRVPVIAAETGESARRLRTVADLSADDPIESLPPLS